MTIVVCRWYTIVVSDYIIFGNNNICNIMVDQMCVYVQQDLPTKTSGCIVETQDLASLRDDNPNNIQ